MPLILISPKSDATQILFLKSCIFLKQSGFLHKEVIVSRLPVSGARKYYTFWFTPTQNNVIQNIPPFRIHTGVWSHLETKEFLRRHPEDPFLIQQCMQFLQRAAGARTKPERIRLLAHYECNFFCTGPKIVNYI